MSCEAIRLVQELRDKANRTALQLREAEAHCQATLAEAHTQSVLIASVEERYHQICMTTEMLRCQQQQELEIHAELLQEIEAVENEFAIAERYSSMMVPTDDFEKLDVELREALRELSEAELECEALKAELDGTREAQHRRERRLEERHRDAQEQREKAARCLEERNNRAQEVSAKAMAEEQNRDTRRQLERLETLGRRREYLEKELQRLSSENSSMEQRLDSFRQRNKTLEQKISREEEFGREQEALLQMELRRQQQPLKILQGLLKEPWMEPSERAPASADVSRSCRRVRSAGSLSSRKKEISGLSFG